MHRWSCRRQGGRRVVAASFVAVVVAAAAGACGTDDASSSDLSGLNKNPVAGEAKAGALEGVNLTWVTSAGVFGDAHQQAFLDPFGEQTGAKVALDPNVRDLAKLQGMIEGDRVTWDVVSAFNYIAGSQCDKLYQTLDMRKLDVSHTNPAWVTPCSVPISVTPVVLVYDSERFADDPPTSFRDFFDVEKYPGKRGMPVTPGFPYAWEIEMALQADGVAEDGLYPLDFDRAYAKYAALGENLVPAATPAELQQALENQDLAMAVIWAGTAYQAAQNGAEYKPVYGDIWSADIGSATIPVKASNVEASYALLNFALGAQQGEKFVSVYPSASANLDAAKNSDTAEWMPTADELRNQHVPDWHYYSDPAVYGQMVAALTKFSEGLAG